MIELEAENKWVQRNVKRKMSIEYFNNDSIVWAKNITSYVDQDNIKGAFRNCHVSSKGYNNLTSKGRRHDKTMRRRWGQGDSIKDEDEHSFSEINNG